MGKLYLIRGLPGSGKTTRAKEMVKNGVMDVHLEADQFFEVGGEYKFNPQMIGEAHKWCQAAAAEALADDKNVVVSNTFTQWWEMAEYFLMAKEMSVKVLIWECNGRYGSIHGVPDHAMKRMEERWEPYLPPLEDDSFIPEDDE